MLNCVQLFVTLWTVARFLCPWDFLGKNTGMGCDFLLQDIFLIKDRTHIFCVWYIDRWIWKPPKQDSSYLSKTRMSLYNGDGINGKHGFRTVPKVECILIQCDYSLLYCSITFQKKKKKINN